MLGLLRAIVSILRSWCASTRGRSAESGRGGEQHDATGDAGTDSRDHREPGPEPDSSSELPTDSEADEAISNKLRESPVNESYDGTTHHSRGETSTLNASKVDVQDYTGAGSHEPPPLAAEQPLEGAADDDERPGGQVAYGIPLRPLGQQENGEECSARQEYPSELAAREHPPEPEEMSHAVAGSCNPKAKADSPPGTVASAGTQGSASVASGTNGDSKKSQPRTDEKPSAVDHQVRPCLRCGITCLPHEVEDVFGYRTMKWIAGGGESVAVHRHSYCRACRTEHPAEMWHRKKPGDNHEHAKVSRSGVEGQIYNAISNEEGTPSDLLQPQSDAARRWETAEQTEDESTSFPAAIHGENTSGVETRHPRAPDLGLDTGVVRQEAEEESDETVLSLTAKSAESPDQSDHNVSGTGEPSTGNVRDNLEAPAVVSNEEPPDAGLACGETGETWERSASDVSSGGGRNDQESSTNGEHEQGSDSVPPVRTRGRRKRAPRYRAPGGGPPTALSASSRRPGSNASGDTATRSRAATIEVRVLFQRGGYCSVTLLPKRPPDFPEELLVEGGASNIELIALEDEWYQDIVPDNLNELLREGLVLTDSSTGQEWVLSGREVFVLASGAAHRGLVSSPRLALGRDHVVLCATCRLSEVEETLREAGCSSWTRLAEDDGVPPGWTIVRGVSPQKAVLPREGEDILNILRPLPEIEIELEGGIRLAYNSWLHGYPPAIRVYGDPEHTETVLIDGQEAARSEEEAYTAPGWADLGEHQVWCGNTSKSYSIVASEGTWKFWPAYLFSPGGNRARAQEFSFCGPLVRPVDRTQAPDGDPGRLEFVQVPPSNPILIGAKPGEVFLVHRRHDLRGARCFALPTFEPVWALPAQPLHCDKETSRILLIGQGTAVQQLDGGRHVMSRGGDVERWFRLILDASRKGLAVEPAEPYANQLWNTYKTAARKLRRRLR